MEILYNCFAKYLSGYLNFMTQNKSGTNHNKQEHGDEIKSNSAKSPEICVYLTQTQPCVTKTVRIQHSQGGANHNISQGQIYS